MFLPKAPCKDCPDRILGCHTTCEKYKCYKEEYKEKTQELDKLREYYDYKVMNISNRNAQLALKQKRKGG